MDAIQERLAKTEEKMKKKWKEDFLSTNMVRKNKISNRKRNEN